jgi:hypothetical protein
LIKLIPNPLNKDENLLGLAKKSEMVVETFSLLRAITSIIIILVITVIFVISLALPPFVNISIIVYIFVSSVLTQVIRVWKINLINNINKDNQAKGILRLRLTGHKYVLINSSVSILLTLLFLLELVIVDSEVLEFNLFSLSTFFDIKIVTVIYLILASRAADLVVNLFGFVMINRIVPNEDFASVSRDLSLLKRQIEILKLVFGAVVILSLLYLFQIPFNIIALILLIIVMFLVLSIWEIIRLKSVDLESTSSQGIGLDLETSLDEKVIYALFGIMNLNRTGFAFLGVGKTDKPENSLLITNKRLLFIEIPMPGNSKMVEGTNYSDMNFFWNRGEIVKNGKELLKTHTLSEIIKRYGVKSFKFEDIKRIELHKMLIKIETNSADKAEYVFMDREHIDPSMSHLKQLLGEKFTSKQ